MHKDSSGHVGFIYKSGKITSLVKDGSAARNGLLTEHYICEINGQNVIGLKVGFWSLMDNCIHGALMLLLLLLCGKTWIKSEYLVANLNFASRNVQHF